jgi:hypothetical protein
MHPDTERLIRSDIRLRRLPLYAAFWIFVGTVAGLGLIGLLGFLDRFLRSNGWIH